MSIYYLITTKKGERGKTFRLKSNLAAPSPLDTMVALVLEDPSAEMNFWVREFRHYVHGDESSEKGLATIEPGDFYMILAYYDFDPATDDIECEVDDPDMYWRSLAKQGWEEVDY